MRAFLGEAGEWTRVSVSYAKIILLSRVRIANAGAVGVGPGKILSLSFVSWKNIIMRAEGREAEVGRVAKKSKLGGERGPCCSWPRVLSKARYRGGGNTRGFPADILK